MKKVKIGLYGNNGHQITERITHSSQAMIKGFAGFTLPVKLKETGVKPHSHLKNLLNDPDIDMISLCSPLRSDQGKHIISCLQAGKHVLAEKPCTMDEDELNKIISLSKEKGLFFHEMGAGCYEQPYTAISKIIKQGILGDVIQVFSQKSYPWADWRSASSSKDGGLAMQVGIYNARFAEHVAGVKIKSMISRETAMTENNKTSTRAVSSLMEFENGGTGVAMANYLGPSNPFWSQWGYEILRIFGTNGFIEALDKGREGTLFLNNKGNQPLDFSEKGHDLLDMFLNEIITGKKTIPLTIEEELSPTRWVIRSAAERI